MAVPEHRPRDQWPDEGAEGPCPRQPRPSETPSKDANGGAMSVGERCDEILRLIDETLEACGAPVDEDVAADDCPPAVA